MKSVKEILAGLAWGEIMIEFGAYSIIILFVIAIMETLI